MLGLRARAFCTCFLVCLAAAGHSQIIWDESIDGDLSDDRINPTSLVLSLGSNGIVATSQPGDREYVHLNLPTGLILSGIVLVSYESDDPIAFIGVQEGTTFTEPPEGTEVANLLGYTLFGDEHVGTDILPAMGTAFGTIGFVPPLTGSDYTFWIQQTGDPSTYHLSFVTVPEPTTLIGFSALAAILLRRRRNSA